jgi:hypothetical protein
MKGQIKKGNVKNLEKNKNGNTSYQNIQRRKSGPEKEVYSNSCLYQKEERGKKAEGRLEV